MKFGEYLFFLFALLHFAGADDFNEIVTSILGYFRCRSVIFVINDDSSYTKFLKLQKFLNSNNELYFSTSMTLSTLSKALKRGYHSGKRTTIVVEFSEFNETFSKLTHEVDITPYKWFITTPTFYDINIEKFKIPFLCEFMIAVGNASLGYNLTEIYEIEKKKIVRPVGRWIGGSGLETTSVGFFTRRKNLEKVNIKVVIDSEDFCPKDLSFINGTAQIVVCYHSIIWRIITEMLNVTTKHILVPRLLPNTVVEVNDIHLSLRSAPINTNHLNTRTYTWPLIKVQFEVFSSYVGQELEWGTFVLPFSNKMWMVIGIWIVACDLIVILAEFVACMRVKNEKPWFNYYSKYSFLNFFAFTNQDVSDSPVLFSYRLLIFLMFMVPTVILPAYSAVLTSFVTILIPKMPFKNLQELSQTKDYHLGWHRPFPYQMMFRQNDTDPVNQALMANNVLKEHEMPETDKEAMDRLCSTKFVYISTINTLSALKPKCKFFKLDQHFLTVFVAMEAKKNLQYEFVFSRCIKKIRMSGMLDRTLDQVLMRILQFRKIRPPKTEDFQPIIMENCILPFAILFTATLLSIVILLLEIVCYKKGAQKLIYLP